MTFQIIYEYITDKVPQLATKNTFIIGEWLAKGYDAEKDVKPAVDASTKRGVASIYSFGFFTPSIARYHSDRIQKLKTSADPKSDADRDKIRADRIRWCIERGVVSTNLSPADKEWLENYDKGRRQA